MTRANARELAVHLIYSRAFTDEDPRVLVESRLEKTYYAKLAEENKVYSERPDPLQMSYIDCVVTGVANRTNELNEIIQRFSIGWDITRISRLARAIMQLAVFEILYMDEVPTGVAISEAVRIAKLYDGNEAGSFINGILGSFSRSLASEVNQ